jgi:hypothetical protein
MFPCGSVSTTEPDQSALTEADSENTDNFLLTEIIMRPMFFKL